MNKKKTTKKSKATTKSAMINVLGAAYKVGKKKAAAKKKGATKKKAAVTGPAPKALAAKYNAIETEAQARIHSVKATDDGRLAVSLHVQLRSKEDGDYKSGTYTAVMNGGMIHWIIQEAVRESVLPSMAETETKYFRVFRCPDKDAVTAFSYVFEKA